MVFSGRREAGKLLARKLLDYKEQNPVVVALPRGGVIVGIEVARTLNVAFDVAVVRELPHPLEPDQSIGALSEEDFHWIDPQVRSDPAVTADLLEKTLVREAEAIENSVKAIRSDYPPLDLEGKTVILVDDCLENGLRARAAAHLARGRGAKKVILAVPTCPEASAESLTEGEVVDALICAGRPEEYPLMEQFAAEPAELSDEEMARLLRKSRKIAEVRHIGSPTRVETVTFEDGPARLRGTLTIPPFSNGLVIFSHAGGSGKLAPRKQYVAHELQRASLATFLFDLLTLEEGSQSECLYDIPLLARRLQAATLELRKYPAIKGIPIGYLGISTGAAAALWAAADPRLIEKTGGEERIAAIVSRGGRPDLAQSRLARVGAPTLLIVGGHDELVLELNRKAMEGMPHADLVVVPGASHLFEEPGTLDAALRHAIAWFNGHFSGVAGGAPKKRAA